MLNKSLRLDSKVLAFSDQSNPPVRGFLHRPSASPNKVTGGDALVLTHGAGSDCQAPLLIAVANHFAAAGFTVFRCDLPYRQKRPHGPPFPGASAEDRDGLRNAVAALRGLVPDHPFKRVFLGGHSYGGRQATILAAAEMALADALLLLSYPLHPPRKPDQVRTAHFPKLRTPALFVQGTRDPFGSREEMESALKLIPATTALFAVDGAGHDLSFGKRQRNATPDLPSRILDAFVRFLETSQGERGQDRADGLPLGMHVVTNSYRCRARCALQGISKSFQVFPARRASTVN